MKKIQALILAAIFTILIALNVFFLSANQRQPVIIKEVIDGDTFKTTENENIRLININTPEKNEYGYEEAKNFLKKIENKEIKIERLGTEKYGRTLARIYASDYLNLKIVEEGLATKFLVQESEKEEFANAEENAIKNEKGIWNKSAFFGCFQTEINYKDEFVILKNSCEEVNLQNWTLKDESRKRYKFENVSVGRVKIYSGLGNDSSEIVFWKSKENIWNNDRDTLYLFNEKNNIAHYDFYGY